MDYIPKIEGKFVVTESVSGTGKWRRFKVDICRKNYDGVVETKTITAQYFNKDSNFTENQLAFAQAGNIVEIHGKLQPSNFEYKGNHVKTLNILVDKIRRV